MFESLENRVLLTAAFDPQNGQLTLTSVSIADSFSLVVSGSIVTVTIAAEGFHAEYPISQIQALRVTCNPNGAGTPPPGSDVFVDPLLFVPTTITGGNGDDTLLAGSGPTSISGGNGADFIVGGIGNDTLEGEDGRAANTNAGIVAGDDTLYGGGGNDLLIGGGGPNNNIGDMLLGEGGNDTLRGGAGADFLDGGSGTDTLDYTDKAGTGVNVVFPAPAGTYNANAAITATNFPIRGQGTVVNQQGTYNVTERDLLFTDLASIAGNTYQAAITALAADPTPANTDGSFEVFDLSAGSDLAIVSTLPHGVTIRGNAGVDSMQGSLFPDLIDGGANAGGSPRDGFGYDILVGLDGNDTLLGGTGNDDADGGEGTDSIDGGGNDDLLHGDNGNDTIAGGDGDDLLVGNDGDDLLQAGLEGDGEDTMQGEAGFDTVDYSARTSAVRISFDTVHDDGSPTVGGANGERDFVTETVEKGIGTAFNDVMFSTPSDTRDRVFVGGDGNDSLTGGGGNITLDGGLGNDTLVGGKGIDSIIGGGGLDLLDYSTRTTAVFVVGDTNANDGHIHATTIETVIGGSGNDTLNFNLSSNAISLVGGAGNDTISGGGGADTVDGGVGADDLSGGGGVDTVDYSGRTTSITVSFDNNANDGSPNENDNVRDDIEVVTGSQNADNFDLSTAGAAHSINGGLGNDTIIGSEFDDTIDGGADNDFIVGGAGADALYGGDGNDTVDGGGGDDRVVGGSGKDSLIGDHGSDTLVGGKGADTMEGNLGPDWVSYYYETRPVFVTLNGLPEDGPAGENDLVMPDVENIEGGKSNDKLTGSAKSNVIEGGGGNDLLIGLNGNDTLRGEAGSDTMNGGSHTDSLVGGSGADRFIGGRGFDTADYSDRFDDLIISINNRADDGADQEFDKIDYDMERVISGAGNDKLSSGHFDATLEGRDGNDTLIGGSRSDSLIGGLGNDSILGGGSNDTLVANDGDPDTLDGGDGDNDALLDGGLDTAINVN